MGDNSHYWTDREKLGIKAKQHTEKMSREHTQDIAKSVAETKLYDGRSHEFKTCKPSLARQFSIQETTNNALFRLKDPTKKTVLLNFASYLNPGGCFLQGSSAQEESLCHHSFLYEVIKEISEYYDWNQAHKNKGMYEDRALYSPDIFFFSEDGNIRKADVLTCAAPNRSLLLKYHSFTEENNHAALTSRIEFIKNICVENNCEQVILGAWGCGVFCQDPENIASLFISKFSHTGMTVIYAIPDEKTFKVFQRQLIPFSK